MKTVFTLGEIEEFKRLLKKVAADGYYFPDEEAMRVVHSIVSMWAPEIVIVKDNGENKKILLTVYEGGIKEFQGKWHIPGGYNRWPEMDIQETVSRVAQREIGVDVCYKKTVDSYKWRDGEHSYGHPLSLFVECLPRKNIIETEKLRFFSKDEIPANTVEPHRRFIQQYLK